jgi:carbamoyltransferase
LRLATDLNCGQRAHPSKPRRSDHLLILGEGASATSCEARGEFVNIIGISFGYHDSACCLLQNGQVLAAAQEERFSRIKNDKSFPAAAFRYCLDQAALSIAGIGCIAYYEDPSQKLARQLWMGMLPGLSLDRRASIERRALGIHPQEEIRSVTGFDGRIEIVDHHLSHAASAYFYSGFKEAAILTVDGVGEWPTTTYNSARGLEIERLEQVDFPNSLGLFYSAITGYLGFEVNEGEYKVMGLAPYGQPSLVGKIRQLIEEGPDGQYRLDFRYFPFLQEDRMFSAALCELLGAPARSPESALTQFHMDVARSAQLVLEEILLSKVRYLHRRVPSDSLCMAGGVALNVVANSRCLREGPFKRLFVQPAAGDAGGCLGAAAIAHVRLCGTHPHPQPLQQVYLGPTNSVEKIHHVLNSSAVAHRDFRADEAGLIECVVDRLVEGKVVAWVCGRMEFGPRSLGARSILADPRSPEMRDRINALVKHREAFRPFAPAVLEAFATEHFDLDHPSPFMLEVCQVISSIKLPAITHVDGTARVQTVTAAANRRFAELLKRFYDRTGCPILLNTSFNLRGEPIVCDFIDAISTFARSKIDTLVLESVVLDRAAVPQAWHNFRTPRSAHQFDVYAML